MVGGWRKGHSDKGSDWKQSGYLIQEITVNPQKYIDHLGFQISLEIPLG
jgi:hypothetical protein